MKSKGEFIKQNIAQLSKEPTLVSQSEIPNFVEFVSKKLEEGEEEEGEEKEDFFYMKIVGDGYVAYDSYPYSTIIITNEAQDHTYWFVTKHDNALNLNPPENDALNTTYVYDITDAPNALIARRLTESFNKCDFLSSIYNIQQVMSTEGEESTSGVYIKFKLKDTTKKRYFGFTHYANEDDFTKYFAEYGDNPFQNDLKRGAATEGANIKVLEDNNKIAIRISGKIATENEEEIKRLSTIIFTDKDGTPHQFQGTKDAAKVNSNTFFIKSVGKDKEQITAENLKYCLSMNQFLSSNYEIKMSYLNNKFEPLINITPLNLKNPQEIKAEVGRESFLTFDGGKNKITASHDDAIFNRSANASIELEVYTNTGSLLGEKKFPEESLGTYMTTLRKSYHGQPLWFDLNALMANRSTYSNEFLNAESWCDAGTATDYRFIARRFDGTNREPFYLSDVLHTITGYNRNLEINDLDEYVYNTEFKNSVKPLTHQPTLYHVKGQTQYFNFILSDANRVGKHQTGITYKLYTQSNDIIAEEKKVYEEKDEKGNLKKLSVVNTIKLDLDGVIGKHEKVGYVKVYLNVAGEEKSHPLTFRILPECLYEVNDFAFLNALGGWNSFNFGGDKKTDFKASSTNIFKTQTPSYNTSSEIESVYSQDVKEQFSVKTMPIDATTVEWLKEMSASMAVYELSTKRYILVDELNIKPNSKDELFEVEMKYRYSDSFNGRIK